VKEGVVHGMAFGEDRKTIAVALRAARNDPVFGTDTRG
jgi:hypothetical protein